MGPKCNCDYCRMMGFYIPDVSMGQYTVEPLLVHWALKDVENKYILDSDHRVILVSEMANNIKPDEPIIIDSK